MQLVGSGQDTLPMKLLPGPFGLGTTDHAEPFHDSTNVCAGPLPVEPTATQFVTEVHATPASKLCVGDGFGLGTTAQVVPFHHSVRVSWFEPLKEYPTATHALALGQATSFSTLLLLALTLGLGTTAHVLPFQCSVNVSSGLAPFTAYQPTAIQFVGPLHDTFERMLNWTPGTLGLGTIDQAEIVAADAGADSPSAAAPRHASATAMCASGL
jgi:hypothetical protein